MVEISNRYVTLDGGEYRAYYMNGKLRFIARRYVVGIRRREGAPIDLEGRLARRVIKALETTP